MKYVGSKNRISKFIVPYIQACIDDNEIKTYIEPFVGGFNIIDKIVCEERIGNDVDNLPIDLVNLALKNPEILSSLPIPYPSKEEYYNVRDNAEKYDKGYRAAILLFASYNSRVYGGCYGAFAKIKDGNIRNYFNEAKNNFLKQLPNLKGVKTICSEYKSLEIPSNSMVYCDPPYANGIGYSINFNTEEFWEWVRKQSENSYVLVSEYEAPSDFVPIWSMTVKTHMNNRGKLEKVEHLFTYKKGKYANYKAEKG